MPSSKSPRAAAAKITSPEALHPALYRWRPVHAKEPSDFPLGLGQTGLHEVCEANFGDMAALTGFALAAAAPKRGAIAWIVQRRLALDHGALLPAGFCQVCREPRPIVSIDAGKPGEALWAIEEAVRSAAVGCVIAEIDTMDFTASRRLALASGRYGVPVILLMPYACEGSTAASARWRVSPRPSSPNLFDPRAPGHVRWRAVLERTRRAPHMAGKVFDLELNDETLSLSVVSGLAAYAPAPRARRADERCRANLRKRA